MCKNLEKSLNFKKIKSHMKKFTYIQLLDFQNKI